MENQSIEELFIEASESPDASTVDRLLDKLSSDTDLNSEDISSNLEFLLDAWNGSVDKSEAKARFCISIAEMSAPDTPLFRNLLNDAAKKILPPYLSKSGFLRALGLRDREVPISEVALRLKNLLKLQVGILVFRMETKSWGKISNIDSFASSVAVSAFTGTSTYAVPLAKLLSEDILFKMLPQSARLAAPSPKNPGTSTEYRKLLDDICLNPIDNSVKKEIAFHSHIPGIMTASAFEEWWKKADSKENNSPAQGERNFSDARSIHEFHVLLNKAEGESAELTIGEEEKNKLIKFFTSLKEPSRPKDCLMLAEAVSKLTSQLKSSEDRRNIFEPLKKKCPFWPEEPGSASRETLRMWGSISAKHLEQLAEVTHMLFGSEYTAKLILLLPQKCIGPFSATLSLDELDRAISQTGKPGADILLWLWKNRSKCNDSISRNLNMANVAEAISEPDLPKEWASAQRELKRIFLDRAEFQKILIKNAEARHQSVLDAIQKIRGLHPGEQQSLLVKLSRISPEIKTLLEEGESKKFSQEQDGDENSASSLIPQGPEMTSQYAFNKLHAELKHIINVDTPENREALKTARAHGDFRENAEYDAAKERRDFLARRRAELERDLNNVQVVDFSHVNIDNRALVGCTVELEKDNGGIEKYHLVGAWDGDPDTHCVSYKTRMGAKLLGKVVGEKIELPDGSSARLKSVSQLPSELLKKYADEK